LFDVVILNIYRSSFNATIYHEFMATLCLLFYMLAEESRITLPAAQRKKSHNRLGRLLPK
jgi:hypothetical protein